MGVYFQLLFYMTTAHRGHAVNTGSVGVRIAEMIFKIRSGQCGQFISVVEIYRPATASFPEQAPAVWSSRILTH